MIKQIRRVLPFNSKLYEYFFYTSSLPESIKRLLLLNAEFQLLKNYLIIESDKKNSRVIERVLLSIDKNSSVVHKCHVTMAMEYLITNQPELVFINVDNLIEQPFDFTLQCHLLDIKLPQFVALSTSTQQAYKAIKHNFFDYLLLPLCDTDLYKCISRYQKQFGNHHEYICLKSYKDYQYLNTHDILFLKADNNTTDFHMSNGKTISAFKTLKTYETKLPSHFMRIHKSYIVNTLKISRIDYGKTICMLQNLDLPIPFSKKFYPQIRKVHTTLCNASMGF